jgi:hypothetical protein
MLTRGKKRTLLLKLNDPQVYSFITTMEDHLHKRIRILENVISEADEELEDMESYVFSLQKRFADVRNFGVYNGIIAGLAVMFVAFTCNC